MYYMCPYLIYKKNIYFDERINKISNPIYNTIICGEIKQNGSELEHIIVLVFYLVLFSIRRSTFFRKPH